MKPSALALAGLLTVGVLALPVLAVSLGAQRGIPPDKPSDVNALLFELANAMGMLRGLQQEDSILTLELWATGTLTAGQQRSELPEFRMSVNYAVPGMRVDFLREGTQSGRQIHVVAGATAWNETERGLNATAAPAAVKDRLAQLWTTPMGIVKAARAAGGKATVTRQGAETVLSFPLPAPAADVMVSATVRKDASLAAPSAAALKDLVGTYVTRVVTSGAVVSETTFAEYGDWNWDDYKADVMLPRRIMRRSGDTTLAITTKNTNTYNPYVVMPVPANLGTPASSR